jgi:hypothetical protein
MFPQIPLAKNLWTHCQIEHGIGNESNAVNLPNPCRFNTAHDCTGHERVDITIGQDDEAGAKSRKDAVFELVGEIRRIEQA